MQQVFAYTVYSTIEDIDNQITLWLPDRDLGTYFCIDRYTRSLGKDSFWRLRFIMKYGTSIDKSKDFDLSYRGYYKQMKKCGNRRDAMFNYVVKNHLTEFYESIMIDTMKIISGSNTNQGAKITRSAMCKSVYYNNYEMALRLEKITTLSYYQSQLVVMAIKKGDKDNILALLGENKNYHLSSAFKYRKNGLFDFLLANGANINKLSSRLFYNNLDLLKETINKGLVLTNDIIAVNIQNKQFIDFALDQGLIFNSNCVQRALETLKHNLVNKIWSNCDKEAKEAHYDIYYGKTNIVVKSINIMIKEGIHINDINGFLKIMMRNKNFVVIKVLLQAGANISSVNITHDMREEIDTIISEIAYEKNPNYCCAISTSTKKQCKNVITFSKNVSGGTKCRLHSKIN